MPDIAIKVEKLSKLYRIGALRRRHDTLRDHLVEGLKSFFSQNGHHSDTGRQSSATNHPGVSGDDFSDAIWALKEVSFDVKPGEVIGIIGHNGAGKSTLLKILSRITEPTNGRIEMYGRVASLLEVGTGFHAELTGRENVYLNGALLGMHRGEINRKFDEIVAFSGVEKFIDTPVKRYSSGMYVRLAFAVAAHLEPEILIVDEVLAVGDAEFQKKCLGKIGNVAKEGRTVLVVSHNMATIECLCHKAMALQGGELVFGGTPKETIDHYLHSIDGRRRSCSSHVIGLSNAVGRPSGVRPLLQRLELFTDGDRPVRGGLKMGASLTARIHFRLEEPTTNLDGILAFDNLLGQRVFHAHSSYQPNRPQGKWAGDQTFVCHIPSLTLVPGEYKLKVALDIDNSNADTVGDAARLTIIESDFYGSGKVPRNGVFVLQHCWYIV
jgi:lipopolysaccharide transport system ATP-binding protein